MEKTISKSHSITKENNGLCLTEKYEKIRKGDYKLTMEIPFKFERVYQEDILEVDEIVEWIMILEMVEEIED